MIKLKTRCKEKPSDPNVSKRTCKRCKDTKEHVLLSWVATMVTVTRFAIAEVKYIIHN